MIYSILKTPGILSNSESSKINLAESKKAIFSYFDYSTFLHNFITINHECRITY